MQITCTYRKHGVSYLVYLGLLLVALAGYWPVTTGLFAVKNDDVIYFLPYRYNIVENLRNGFLPYWSPYVFMGMPLAGDMQSGAWNPLVWLLSLTGRYTLGTLHAELLIYLYASGVGMYHLCRSFKFAPIVCWLLAIAYMFSGFMVDSGQILCWVACAAVLPFTYLFFNRLRKQPTIGNAAGFGLAHFLLLVGGYPFFLIANAYVFLLFYFVFMARAAFHKQAKIALRLTLALVASACFFLLCSTAPLLAFSEMLPYYARGDGLPLRQALHNSYTLFSSISLALPLAITKPHEWFGDQNPISRNLYVGILLLPFVLRGAFWRRTSWSNYAMFGTLAAFALSLGQQLPIRTFAYRYLPLMDTFRHPANFRIFVILGLLMLAGKGLNDYLLQPKKGSNRLLVNAYGALAAILVICSVVVLASMPPADYNIRSLGSLKYFFDQMNFRSAVLIGALIQLHFVGLAVYFTRRLNPRALLATAALNVVIVAQPQIFYSMVGKESTARINAFIARQPKGFPLPNLEEPVKVAGDDKTYPYGRDLIGYFFIKQVAVNLSINNPTLFTTYGKFMSDSTLQRQAVHYPFSYLADSVIAVGKEPYWFRKRLVEPNLLTITAFSPNQFRFATNAAQTSGLVIFQNNYPGWKARVDGRPLAIQTVNRTFMGILVPTGKHEVSVAYHPYWHPWGLCLTIAGLVVCMALLVGSRLRRRDVERL